MRHFRLLIMVVLALFTGLTAFAQNDGPEDITDQYLTNANLSSLNGWQHNGYTDWKTDGAVPVVEFWNWSNQFSFTQTITLPAGNYRLAVNSFYRNSWRGDGTNNHMVWIFAKNVTQDITLKEQDVIALNNMAELNYVGSNDLYKAATAFSQGKYSNEFDFTVEANDTQVQIGFTGTTPNGGWCILGPVKLYQYSLNDYLVAYREKVAEAEALYNTPMNAQVLLDLQNAVLPESNFSLANEVTAQIAILNEKIAAANTSIAEYAATNAAFTEYDAKVANLDQAGQDVYNTAVASIKSAYNNRTMVGDQSAAVKAAYMAALKQQTTPNADITECAPTEWVGQNGIYFFDNYNLGMAERYNALDANSSYEYTGDVMTQTIEGLPQGFYKVVLKAAASFTSGRGFTCKTGDGLAVVFANDQTVNLPVIERYRISDHNDCALYEVIGKVGTDGVLKYGIKKLDPLGGNWFLVNLISISRVTNESSNEAYALLSTDESTLTFYYDNQKASRQGTVYALNEGKNSPGWNKNSITTVIFDASFSNARPTTTYYWFSSPNLTTIININNLNTSKVTNMSGMFHCKALKSVDVGHFDTSNVTDMSSMFYGCDSLTSLDLSNFDTSKVTNMLAMFEDCKSLTNLDLSHFDTSNVTHMEGMFHNCVSLTSLDLSHFDTSNVEAMYGMFLDCSSLSTLDISHFNTSKVSGIEGIPTYGFSGMFMGCSSLKNLDLSHFDTSNALDMVRMFYGCSSLTSIDVSHFDTSKVKYMNEMFAGCSALSNLDVSNFYISDETNTSDMFTDCSSLKSLNISSTMNKLDNTACINVGATDTPCLLIAPEGFDFGEGVNPSGDSFQWKSGWFTLFDYPEVDEEDPFQKYLDELTEQQEMREEYADPDEELDPFQKYLDLLDNDITLTSPKTMVPGTVLTIANGGFSANAWNGGDHVFDIPEGSGLVLNDITVDFSSEANYGTESQLGLFDVSGDLTLGENTIVKGWLDTTSSASNAPHASATDGVAKNRLASGGQVSGAVVSLQSGSSLCIDGARLDDVVLLLNADETNVKATAPLQGELKVVVPESALVEGYKLMVGEGYTFTLADAISVNIVNGGGEWGAEVARDGSLSLFPLSIMGDVNGDGQVTITDVAAVVDYILGNTTGYFREAAANVVRDKGITISDVTTIVQMILGE